MIIQPAERTQTVNEYYFAAKLRELDELKRQGKKILNLGIGSPDMMPHDDVTGELGYRSRQAGSNGYQIGLKRSRSSRTALSVLVNLRLRFKSVLNGTSSTEV